MNRMIFEYKKWDRFCHKLRMEGYVSIPACNINENNGKYIILKHDVETNVHKAFELAKIENKYGHRGSYYVQAYLMSDKQNVDLLIAMKKMGHEISYHYDVMDSCKGNLNKAIIEFEKNKNIFEKNGFNIKTVCQHGNPVIDRIGYTSNRDFFRSRKVQELYPEISDIMVDYKIKYSTNYTYFSDAGRKFNIIFDPINNDLIPSDDKNIKCDDLDDVFKAIKEAENVIISTHPHRWTSSSVEYVLKNFIFKLIKNTAKLMLHIPGMKKIMGRFYYLAKKI